MKRSDLKSLRREEASSRDEIRNSRSPQDQLKVLDTKLGNGLGAVKERKKLNELIKNSNEKTKVKKTKKAKKKTEV